jgi:hypothetical protein
VQDRRWDSGQGTSLSASAAGLLTGRWRSARGPRRSAPQWGARQDAGWSEVRSGRSSGAAGPARAWAGVAADRVQVSPEGGSEGVAVADIRCHRMAAHPVVIRPTVRSALRMSNHSCVADGRRIDDLLSPGVADCRRVSPVVPKWPIAANRDGERFCGTLMGRSQEVPAVG